MAQTFHLMSRALQAGRGRGGGWRVAGQYASGVILHIQYMSSRFNVREVKHDVKISRKGILFPQRLLLLNYVRPYEICGTVFNIEEICSNSKRIHKRWFINTLTLWRWTLRYIRAVHMEAYQVAGAPTEGGVSDKSTNGDKEGAIHYRVYSKPSFLRRCWGKDWIVARSLSC